MKRAFAFLLLAHAFLAAHAANDYPVSSINPLLLVNADVVKRYSETRYEVSSYSKMKVYEKNVFTILNENGDSFAQMVTFYDKLQSVKSIEGRLLDASGKEIKSLKQKDIKDFSAVMDISLIDDNRVKSHNFYHKTYPYTVEYEVVTEVNNTFTIPSWRPVQSDRFAVEQSKLMITSPASMNFNYKMFNYTGEPMVSEVKGNKVYTWEVKNLMAITREYAAPDWAYLTTTIFFNSDKFELEGYKGSMSSWQSFGQFQLKLNEGRDKLPDAIRQKVHQLTDHLTDPKEKTKVLYEYLQKNTRYVSIQLGIGGWQPFDASYVANKSYGDCKALSNYMYSLLKEAGIKSCYTIIKAGDDNSFFITDFPNNQFNHIILCVPMPNDSVWLECTSQINPFGYLGSFTSNRYALLVDETGGHLVRTPKYGVNENEEVKRVTATLDTDGGLKIKTHTKYRGLRQDYIHSMINSLSKEKVKEHLQEQLDFATYDINQFEYKEIQKEVPVVNESLDIEVSNYATITGKRLFIVPNVMTRSHRKLTPNPDRKYEIVLNAEYRMIDTVEIELPQGGYEPEAIPKDIFIESRFGKYSCSVKLEGNKLRYFRMIEHYNGRFPAKEYDQLVSFYESIYKADRNKVVLVKKEISAPKPF